MVDIAVVLEGNELVFSVVGRRKLSPACVVLFRYFDVRHRQLVRDEEIIRALHAGGQDGTLRIVTLRMNELRELFLSFGLRWWKHDTNGGWIYNVPRPKTDEDAKPITFVDAEPPDPHRTRLWFPYLPPIDFAYIRECEKYPDARRRR